ncbi:MAG TPA: DUF2293 domain-containing protein [Desulfurivibrionaceae bacterium]|nr:DUF2293 domain-containing protein [Desulfurivibrionaceae bacterium]
MTPGINNPPVENLMTHIHRTVQPGRKEGTVLSDTGEVLTPPKDWAFLAAGDAAITRSIKAKGVTWVVQVKMGRRLIAKGLWASQADIQAAQAEVAAKRAAPDYARKRESALARRAVKHQNYEEEFLAAVLAFLAFAARYHCEAQLLAEMVTGHATPVGSGTVARTERIPIAKRAEAAVIAWMRHATTGYDSLRIARVKGKRREVRRQLAAKSVELLQVYRQGRDTAEGCPLKKALG